MGLCLRRRVRLLPGLRLNVSRSGLSLSVGHRGAWVTIGPGGQRRATFGLPGTGLSYTQHSGGDRRLREDQVDQVEDTQAPDGSGLLSLGIVLLVVIIVCAIFWYGASS